MVIILMPLQSSSLSPHGETPGSRVLRSEASCSALLDVRQQSVCDDGVFPVRPRYIVDVSISWTRWPSPPARLFVNPDTRRGSEKDQR